MFHSDLLLMENHPKKSSKPVLIFWSTCSIQCVFCLYTLLKVVSYYDLCVLSMSVSEKFRWGVGGCDEL